MQRILYALIGVLIVVIAAVAIYFFFPRPVSPPQGAAPAENPGSGAMASGPKRHPSRVA